MYWTAKNETLINGFRVSRIGLQRGGYLYFVHWFECPHYAAYHSRMSDKFHSLQVAKRFIVSLESEPMKYFNLKRLKKVKRTLVMIDERHGENGKFGNRWQRAYKLYTSVFRAHDVAYQNLKRAGA